MYFNFTFPKKIKRTTKFGTYVAAAINTAITEAEAPKAIDIGEICSKTGSTLNSNTYNKPPESPPNK